MASHIPERDRHGRSPASHAHCFSRARSHRPRSRAIPSLRKVRDFNGDGKDDIVWRNPSTEQAACGP
jgi:hypothetical protein